MPIGAPGGNVRGMEPRIDLITLAVTDLERSLAFYRDGLGLPTPGIVGTEYPGDETTAAGPVVMIGLGGGLTLALYPATELAKDANVGPATPVPGTHSIGHRVADNDAVAELLRQAEAAGGTVTDAPHERPWGIYSGYFSDPDGHLWEVYAAPDESN